MNKDIDVLVLGYYGFGNLGDELLSETVVALLKKSGVEKERIAILSSSPKDTEYKTGVQAYDRWNFSVITSLMRRSKIFLLGGGGLFQDSTSIRSSAYYWWAVRMAHICGAKIGAIGQSIGPLHTSLARFFAKNAFSICAYRSVRDDNSANTMSKWGFPFAKTPDLVLSSNVKHDFIKGNKLLLNIRPGYSEATKLAVGIANQTACKEKLEIHGIAFSKEDATEMMLLQDSNAVNFVKITTVADINDFEKAIQYSSKAIGMRLHFIELALLFRLPVCGIAYDPKVMSFCNEWDIPVAGQSTILSFSKSDSDKLDVAAEDILLEFQKSLKSLFEECNG